MKAKTKLILFLTTIFIIIFIINIITGYFRHQQLREYDVTGMLPSVYKLTAADSNLIHFDSSVDVKVEEVFRSECRKPVSYLMINKKFRLGIYKIDVNQDFNFRNSTHVECENYDKSVGVDYRVTGRGFFYLLYKGSVIKPVSEIYLTLGCKAPTEIFRNDSLSIYNFKGDNFSVRYKKEDFVDLFFVPATLGDGSDLKQENLDVAFLRRNNGVYLLFMAPLKSKDSINAKLLYNLLK